MLRFSLHAFLTQFSPLTVRVHDSKNSWGKMKAVLLITLTVLYLLAASSVQGFKFGKCPNPAVQKNFDLSMFLGKWYEIQRLSNMFLLGECSTANFSMQTLQSPQVVLVQGEMLANGNIKTISVTARPLNHSEPAKMEVSVMNPAGHERDLPQVLSWVLSTDYESYALVYSCIEEGLFYLEFAWIMSREPTLCEDTTTLLHNNLSGIGVNVAQMTFTNQNDICCQRLRL